MNGYLLDTNLLIALLWPTHDRHDLAMKWFIRHRHKGWATCPFTEAGFVRIVTNSAFSRDAVQPREAISVLSANTAAKDHTFWADDIPLAEAVSFAGIRLIGHQQVTDAYLLGVAIRKGGMLATLDQSIQSLTEPKSAERKAIETIA
jgi:uncharacterized protein